MQREIREEAHPWGRYAPRTLSMNHVIKEKSKSWTWGATIPLIWETNTLPAELAEQMLDIVDNVVW